MPTIKNTIPKDCHLWNNKTLSRQDLYQAFEAVEVYEDDSDLVRSLKKCKQCSQLYFYEFYERMDWSNGNDAQYRTWIPVDDKASADLLATMSSFQILAYSSIRVDFPSDASEPHAPKFMEYTTDDK